MFGMSFVNVVFDEGTDIYWARSRVLEYMSSVRAKLPQGVNPTLGPDATGVGWVFEYALVDRTGKHDLQELRSLHWDDMRLPNVMALVFNGLAFLASVFELVAGRATLLVYLVALAAGFFTVAIGAILVRRGR
jgi:Cu(I)/Ag(I) efflux system membrane protein CusA/SilA